MYIVLLAMGTSFFNPIAFAFLAEERERERERERWRLFGWLVALASGQHASVSQGHICSDNWTYNARCQAG